VPLIDNSYSSVLPLLPAFPNSLSFSNKISFELPNHTEMDSSLVLELFRRQDPAEADSAADQFLKLISNPFANQVCSSFRVMVEACANMSIRSETTLSGLRSLLRSSSQPSSHLYSASYDRSTPPCTLLEYDMQTKSMLHRQSGGVLGHGSSPSLVSRRD
jgi:hypothetical protein